MKINIGEWIEELDSVDEAAITQANYQEKLFLEYAAKSTEGLELLKRLRGGEPLTGEKGLRRELAAINLAYFGRAYLPHYFVRISPKFHEELDEIWVKGVMKNKNPLKENDKISRMDGSRQAIAAPRGHAKSTNFTFKDTLHAVLYGYKHYPIIISDSGEQAEGFLDDLRTELEDNGIIKEDFGQLQGDKVWRTGCLLTKTGIKIEAIGSGKKIRGRRHKNWRPDLLVLDDIENDENVMTPEQRRKLQSWYFKAVSKCGDTYTDIMYIGTILHYDSLLAAVLKNAEYETRKYQAIIRESDRSDLWDEWQSIYTNLFDENHKANARTFYEANAEEMVRGTQVLWQEKFSYYDLMKMRVSEGEASFNSEMQNEPIDPDNTDFQEEWFDWYEDGEVDFKENRYLFVGSNDPSLGKNKKSDTSSIIGLALDLHTGYMYVVDASIEKRKPDVIIEDIFEMNRRYKRDYGKGFYRFGVETVQFQYFFKEVMANISRELGEYLPIEEINSNINKMIRIRSLQPFVKNKWIKFNRKHRELIKQMTEFPMGRCDDAPDGLQMAVALAQMIKGIAIVTKYESVLSRQARFREGAY